MSGGSAKQRRALRRRLERLLKRNTSRSGSPDAAPDKPNVPRHGTTKSVQSPGGKGDGKGRADRWIDRLKNTKLVAPLIVIGFIIGQIVPVVNTIQGIERLIRESSEPLKIQSPIIALHEPWFYLISPNPGQTPVPMWLMFYVTLHNTDSQSIWISNSFVTARTRDKWIQLTPPRQSIDKNTLFFLPSGALKALKPEDTLSYKTANDPIPPDGYQSGWMFFESRTDCICRLEFEFHDKDGRIHRRQVIAANGSFKGESVQTGCASKAVVVSADAQRFAFEDNSPPLSPELRAYMREMYPYISIFQPPAKP
jgi:hypothetical protein